MGKGRYSGGSTIINPFGHFTSFDEAAHDRTEISSEKIKPKPKAPSKAPPSSKLKVVPAWAPEVIAKREVGIDKGQSGEFFLTVQRQLSDIPNLTNVSDIEISRAWNATRFFTFTGKKWTPDLVALARKDAILHQPRPIGKFTGKNLKRTGRLLKAV